jgi:hypothetical protein
MRAHTRPLAAVHDGDLDLNDVAGGDGYLFVRDGVGIAGRGVAARCRSPTWPPCWRPSSTPTRSAASTPSRWAWCRSKPGLPCELVIPQVLVGKAADGANGSPPSTAATPDIDCCAARPAPRAQAFTVAPAHARRPLPGRGAKPAMLCATAAHEGRHRSRGVGQQRRADRRARRAAAPEGQLRQQLPLLGRRLHRRVARAARRGAGQHGALAPLAGTAPRTGDPDTDQRAAAELLASEKNQIEHRVVIDMIHDTLLPWCSYLDWEPEPSIISVANVQHLSTAMEGHLSDPRPNVLELVTALSPTPALGGFPKAEALELIAAQRASSAAYGGAVGWVDAAGDGTWAVAIRCAELSADRRTARLVAGGGIVADSDPLSELAETQAKLQAMLSAIVRP